MFRDDPDPLAEGRAVGAQQPIPMLNRLVILLPILGAHLSPVATRMLQDEQERRLAGLLQGGEGAAGSDDLAQ